MGGGISGGVALTRPQSGKDGECGVGLGPLSVAGGTCLVSAQPSPAAGVSNP